MVHPLLKKIRFLCLVSITVDETQLIISLFLFIMLFIVDFPIPYDLATLVTFCFLVSLFIASLLSWIDNVVFSLYHNLIKRSKLQLVPSASVGKCMIRSPFYRVAKSSRLFWYMIFSRKLIRVSK